MLNATGFKSFPVILPHRNYFFTITIRTDGMT